MRRAARRSARCSCSISGSRARDSLLLPLGAVAGSLLALALLYALAGKTRRLPDHRARGHRDQRVHRRADVARAELRAEPVRRARDPVLDARARSPTAASCTCALALPLMIPGWLLVIAAAPRPRRADARRGNGRELRLRSAPHAVARRSTGTALAVGGAVAVTGVVGFVGLVVPHLLRPRVGHHPSRLLLPSFLGGAVLTTLADVAIRLMPPGPELKLGVVTALLGAPFFLQLVICVATRHGRLRRSTMALVTDALEVRYGARVRRARRLRSRSTAASFVALVGPNGAGKSSLLKALAGLLPHTGTVTWQRPSARGARRARARARDRVPCRRRRPCTGRCSRATSSTLGRLAASRATARRRATRIATRRRVGARANGDGRRSRSAASSALSVGERARVLLARALAVRAPVLLVDEPIAMLDPYHQLQVMAMLRAYARGAVDDPTKARAANVADAGPALSSSPCSTTSRSPRASARRVLLLDDGVVVDDDRPERALSAARARAPLPRRAVRHDARGRAADRAVAAALG